MTGDVGDTDAALVALAPPALTRGRKHKEPLQVIMVRELTQEDVAQIEGSAERISTASVPALRHGHHAIAQALAQGHGHDTVALLTGYDPDYISRLLTYQMFKDLVAHYAAQQAQVFVDVAQRMKEAGLTALDELQSRLVEAPDKWTNTQLMEFTDLTLVKGQGKSGGGQVGSGAGLAGPGGGVNVTVQFVQPATAVHNDRGPVIDVEEEPGNG